VFRLWVYPTEAEFNARGIDIMLWSLAVVTPAWLLVTMLTRPTDRAQLERFYRKVRPAGPGWRSIARTVRNEDRAAAAETGYSIPRSLASWIAATLMVYAILFGTGKLLLRKPAAAACLWAAAAVCFAVLYASMRRVRRNEPPPVATGEVVPQVR
jgi:SSS family solute:Na+ symporter